MKLALLGKGNNVHLFTQLSVDDKIHHFMVDTGSNLSYIFFEPFDLEKTGTFTEYYVSDTVVRNAERCRWREDEIYLIEKPALHQVLDEEYKMKMSGIIGLDYLISNKIVLNFGKIK